MLLGLGATVSLVGVFLSSLTTGIGAYLTCYCLLNGLGCGICYFIPLICGWEWFPDKKGLVTGCILGGYGFGSFIFSQVSTKLVNPNGENPSLLDPNNPNITFYDTDVSDRVPFMIQTLVYIWAGLCFVGVLLIERKPLERKNSFSAGDDPLERETILGQPAQDNLKTVTDKSATTDTYKTAVESSEPTEDSVSRSATDVSELGIPMLGDVAKTPQIKAVKFFWFSLRFWQYFAIMVLSNYFGTFFSYSYKTFGENTTPHPQIGDSLLTWAASIGAGGVNGLSRIAMGSLVDKYSFRFLMSILMTV